MGVHAQLGRYNIKDTLMNGSVLTSKRQPKLDISQDDYNKLLNGQLPSKQFIEDNKDQLFSYLDQLGKQEDKNMMGLREFSQATQGGGLQNKKSVDITASHPDLAVLDSIDHSSDPEKPPINAPTSDEEVFNIKDDEKQ